MSDDIRNKVKNCFIDSIKVKQEILDLDLHQVLLEAGEKISESIGNGGKLLICGNGGSAADAQHLAAEFLVRLTSDVNRESIPALALAQDTSTLTACINDYGSNEIFKRVFTAICSQEDILLVITTSGNSRNILEVLQEAKKRDIYSLGFLGNKGGKALDYCDSAFIVPSDVTARIQEAHITAGHALLQFIEDRLLETGWLNKI
tara:strand:+ start:443 stop:1054 length:612 start_codon:yes stop_codon:yes gene_type:complete